MLCGNSSARQTNNSGSAVKVRKSIRSSSFAPSKFGSTSFTFSRRASEPSVESTRQAASMKINAQRYASGVPSTMHTAIAAASTSPKPVNTWASQATHLGHGSRGFPHKGNRPVERWRSMSLRIITVQLW